MAKILDFISTKTRLFTVAGLALAIVFPWVFHGSSYIVRVGMMALMFVILTLGLNLVTGYMGQTSFGTAAFWGIGAYTGAILSTRTNLDSVIIYILGMVIAGLFALLLGAGVLKLKGYYMSIVTLGFGEIVRLVELNWMDLTRGPLGIVAIPKMRLFGIKVANNTAMFYVILVLCILVTYSVWKLMDSRFGRVITSIRDDEIATQSMGINIVKYKVLAFMIYGMISGLAGVFYAYFMTYIDPTMFKTVNSTEIVIMVIFGGLASISGSYLGAISLTVLMELLRDFVEYRMLIYGLLLVIMMIVKPEGILGNINFKHILQRLRFAAQLKSKGGEVNG